jgi:hypothetical protein
MTSEKVLIRIITKVSFVNILLNGQATPANSWAVVNSESKFRAQYYSGTELTYQWDFGDGTTIQTENTEVIHNFAS